METLVPTLPPNFVASTSAMVSQVFVNFSPYFYLLLAFLGGVLIIEILVSLVRK